MHNEEVVKELWRKAASQGADFSLGFGTMQFLDSMAVCYSSGAVMPLLIILQRTRSSDWKRFSMGRTTPKNCLFPRGIWTPSNTWFHGPTLVSPQSASRSVQPFSQGSRTWPTDRHTETDRPRYSVCSNEPHLAIAVMRSKTNQNSSSLFSYKPTQTFL